MLITDSDCKILFLSDAYVGAAHDRRIADEAGYCFPPGSVLIQDMGLQGFQPSQVTVLQPIKKPRGQLSEEQKAYNALIASVRIRSELASARHTLPDRQSQAPPVAA